MERQEEGRKIRESSYVAEQKNILNRVRGEAEYLGRKCARDRVLTARFSLGSETRGSRYWEQEEERKCRCCGKEEETLRHVLEICEVIGEEGEWWRVIDEEKPEADRLRRVMKRKEEIRR